MRDRQVLPTSRSPPYFCIRYLLHQLFAVPLSVCAFTGGPASLIASRWPVLWEGRSSTATTFYRPPDRDLCIFQDGAHKSAGVRDVHALRRPVLDIRTQYKDVVLAGSIRPLIMCVEWLFVLILQHVFLLAALRRSAHLGVRAAFSITRPGWLVCLAVAGKMLVGA